jgi:hypothetical protein
MATIPPITRAAQQLEIVASELTYIPSPEQRKTKAAFWAKYNDNPIVEPQDITLPIILQFVSDERVTKWWPQSGFKEWFRNKDEFRQRIEYLVHQALDSIEYVLSDPKAQASAKVNAAKLLMEVARKMPPKNVAEQYLDEKIASMSRKELEEYVRSKTPKLIPTKAE